MLAKRFLELEDFSSAKKFMPPAQFALVAVKLEKLTAAANGLAFCTAASTAL